MISIESINIATPETLLLGKKEVVTAIRKKPTKAICTVGVNGLEGDEIGDMKHHGGLNRALHFFSAEHYNVFERQLKEDGEIIPPRPWVGENITTRGYIDYMAHVGDRLKIGTTILEVSMPTERCWVPGASVGIPALAKWMISSKRTGFYLRVIEPGQLSVTDTIEIIEDGDIDWSIFRLSCLMYTDDITNTKWIKKAMEIPTLAQEWKDSVLKKHQSKIESKS